MTVHPSYTQLVNTPEGIVALRTKLNVTQSDLSRLLGISRQAINDWEAGRATPTMMGQRLMGLIAEEADRQIAQGIKPVVTHVRLV